jgi:hypothetical protein
MIDIDNFKPRALFRIVPTIQKNVQAEWEKDYTFHVLF